MTAEAQRSWLKAAITFRTRIVEARICRRRMVQWMKNNEVSYPCISLKPTTLPYDHQLDTHLLPYNPLFLPFHRFAPRFGCDKQIGI